MFRFAHNEYMIGFAAIGLIALLFIIMWQLRKHSIKKFGELELVKALTKDVSANKPILKFVIAILGASMLLVAIMRPQLGAKEQEVKRSGVDLMIALDVSKSMMAEDIRPTRLQRSIHAISKLIDQLKGDRIGIIVFAGQAYTQLPITTDYGAAKLYLSSVSTGMVPTQGTAIGAAIELATESFSDSTHKHAAIVVITDGENHEDDAIEAAKDANKKGITVHTIGMGSKNGSPIPIISNQKRVGFLKDKAGHTVISKLNVALLGDIARAGNGKFIRATTSDDGINSVLESISEMEKQEFGVKLYTDYKEQFQYFIAAAFLLLLLEFIIGKRKTKWLQNLDLFNQNKG
ncbi:MAG: VWA domain-containing protein [Bacteroidia bacterium]|nr:VWA domain-containing protein [Bacteroidia bacterium]NNC84607.1 VWA domain-containing protein [Bacteroidia bacterium]